MKVLLLTGALIICAASSGVAWKSHRATEKTSIAEAHVRKERDELTNHLRSARDRLAALLAKSDPNPTAREIGQTGAPTSDKPNGVQLLASLQLIDKDPKLQILSANATDAFTRKTYAVLYRRLKLTPALNKATGSSGKNSPISPPPQKRRA